MSESEEWWFDVRPKAVRKNRPCPMHQLCSESSGSSSTFDAVTARWYEAFETRVAACAASGWRLSSDWSGGSSGCPTYGREISTDPLCSQCRSVGRRCFACYSRDARAVDRKHDRARMRTTGQSTTGDQSADSHLAQVRDAHESLGSDSGRRHARARERWHARPVRYLSQKRSNRRVFFLSRRAGAVALASRAQTMSR